MRSIPKALPSFQLPRLACFRVIYKHCSSSSLITQRNSNSNSNYSQSHPHLISTWMPGGMTKVHPNASTSSSPAASASSFDEEPLVLTVWIKSLLFNCNGYTVFDSNGNLVFRVDNYMSGSGNKAEILLMGAAGEPLLTIRRKRLSLGENWTVFDGEEAVNPRFSAKKHVNLRNSKCLAHVTSLSSKLMYQIEGSYAQRSCVVYDERRRKVAEIKRKEAVKGVGFGGDVFRLVVNEAGIEAAEAMAVVILLDQMFGSSSRRSLSNY